MRALATSSTTANLKARNSWAAFAPKKETINYSVDDYIKFVEKLRKTRRFKNEFYEDWTNINKKTFLVDNNRIKYWTGKDARKFKFTRDQIKRRKQEIKDINLKIKNGKETKAKIEIDKNGKTVVYDAKGNNLTNQLENHYDQLNNFQYQDRKVVGKGTFLQPVTDFFRSVGETGVTEGRKRMMRRLDAYMDKLIDRAADNDPEALKKLKSFENNYMFDRLKFADLDRFVDRGVKKILRLPLQILTLPFNLKYYYRKWRHGGLYHMLFERPTPEAIEAFWYNQKHGNILAEAGKTFFKGLRTVTYTVASRIMDGFPKFRSMLLLNSDKYRLFYKRMKFRYKYITKGADDANDYIMDLGIRCMNAKRDSKFCYEQIQKITDFQSITGSGLTKVSKWWKRGDIDTSNITETFGSKSTPLLIADTLIDVGEKTALTGLLMGGAGITWKAWEENPGFAFLDTFGLTPKILQTGSQYRLIDPNKAPFLKDYYSRDGMQDKGVQIPLLENRISLTGSCSGESCNDQYKNNTDYVLLGQEDDGLSTTCPVSDSPKNPVNLFAFGKFIVKNQHKLKYCSKRSGCPGMADQLKNVARSIKNSGLWYTGLKTWNYTNTFTEEVVRKMQQGILLKRHFENIKKLLSKDPATRLKYGSFHSMSLPGTLDLEDGECFKKGRSTSDPTHRHNLFCGSKVQLSYKSPDGTVDFPLFYKLQTVALDSVGFTSAVEKVTPLPDARNNAVYKCVRTKPTGGIFYPSKWQDAAFAANNEFYRKYYANKAIVSPLKDDNSSEEYYEVMNRFGRFAGLPSASRCTSHRGAKRAKRGLKTTSANTSSGSTSARCATKNSTRWSRPGGRTSTTGLRCSQTTSRGKHRASSTARRWTFSPRRLWGVHGV